MLCLSICSGTELASLLANTVRRKLMYLVCRLYPRLHHLFAERCTVNTFVTSQLRSSTKMDTNYHFAKGEAEPPMPHDTKLVLYSMRFCPFAHRAHLALNAKNIPYHVIYINLSEKPEWFTTLNPNGRVPALLLKNEPHQPILVESMLICEYLDEKYPDLKLYPSDPLHKAETKLWIQRFDNCHGPYYRLVFAKPADDAVDEQLAQLFQAIDEFEVELTKRGSGFFGGDRPNILDYAIWPWFERFGILKSMYGDKNQFNEHRYPTLIKWYHSMASDAAVAKHLISTYTHTKYAEGRRDGKVNYNILDEES